MDKKIGETVQKFPHQIKEVPKKEQRKENGN